MMEHIKIGAERAGKRLEDVEIVCRHQVIVTDDKESARNAIRAAFAPYYATPVYNAFLAWAGYADVAEQIKAGWAAKDRAKTTSALDDRLGRRYRDFGHCGRVSGANQRVRGNGHHHAYYFLRLAKRYPNHV